MLNKFLNIIFKYRSYMLSKFYEEFQWKSKEDIRAYQLKKLKEIIEYAYENVEFYKKLWDANEVDINITSLNDLKKFPIVDKSMLQSAILHNEISKEFLGSCSKKVIWQSTTGSSGSPFRFPVDLESECHKNGVRFRLYRWYYLEDSTRWAKFWRGTYKKSIIKRLKELLTGQYNFCIHDPNFPSETRLNIRRIQYFINELNRIKPSVIDGFPSALSEISDFILNNNTKLNFKIKSIVTGAEMLDDVTRAKISKAFNAIVFNRYGGTESSIIAHECKHQAISDHFLHIQDDRLILESNEHNELIFTDLTTKSLPFIRYKNGDLGRVDHDYRCKCGRNFGVIKDLHGRVNDVFILLNGEKISSHIWQNYMKKCEGIKKYQMIQERKDFVKINWVKNRDNFNNDDFIHVKELIHNALEDCKIEWIEMDDIDVGIGGKFRQHICLVRQ